MKASEDINARMEWAAARMREHGLAQAGWTFEVMALRLVGGFCTHDQKRVVVAKRRLSYPSSEPFEQAVLHEIGHALLPAESGHGKAWIAKVKKIGGVATISECSSQYHNRGTWVASCERCGDIFFRDHLTTWAKALACGHCCKELNNDLWAPEYMVTWAIRRTDDKQNETGG